MVSTYCVIIKLSCSTLQVNVPRMLLWLSRTWLHRSRSRVTKDSWRSLRKIQCPWRVRSLSQIYYSGLASLIDRSWEDGLYRCYAAFSAGRPQRSGFVSQQFSNWIDRWSLPSKEKPSGSSPQDAESKESNRWSWLAVRTLLFLHPVKAVTKSNNGCPLWILCINRTIGLWLIDITGRLPEEIWRKVLLGVCYVDLLFDTVIIVMLCHIVLRIEWETSRPETKY